VRGFVGFPQKSQIFVGDFSLVHDPKGSYYGNFGVKNFPDSQAEAKIKAEAKLNSLPLAVGVSGEAELRDVWLNCWMPPQSFMMVTKQSKEAIS